MTVICTCNLVLITSIGLVNKVVEQPAIVPAQACIAIVGIWTLNGALFNKFAIFSGGRKAKTNMSCQGIKQILEQRQINVQYSHVVTVLLKICT